MWALSIVARRSTLCGERASHCGGFSCCCTRAQLPRDMWDLPGLGIEPLVSGFFTIRPPGKSFCLILKLGGFFFFSVTASQRVSLCVQQGESAICLYVHVYTSPPSVTLLPFHPPRSSQSPELSPLAMQQLPTSSLLCTW